MKKVIYVMLMVIFSFAVSSWLDMAQPTRTVQLIYHIENLTEIKNYVFLSGGALAKSNQVMSLSAIKKKDIQSDSIPISREGWQEFKRYDNPSSLVWLIPDQDDSYWIIEKSGYSNYDIDGRSRGGTDLTFHNIFVTVVIRLQETDAGDLQVVMKELRIVREEITKEHGREIQKEEDISKKASPRKVIKVASGFVQLSDWINSVKIEGLDEADQVFPVGLTLGQEGEWVAADGKVYPRAYDVYKEITHARDIRQGALWIGASLLGLAGIVVLLIRRRRAKNSKGVPS